MRECTERMAKTPFVSIAIITLNAQQTLPKCLESIRNLAFPYEFLDMFIVDAGSTDRTVAIAEQFRVPVHHISSGSTRGRSTNLCLQMAKGEIVAFVDADNVLPPDWLSKALARFENSAVEAVYCHQITPPRKLHFLNSLIFLATRGYQFRARSISTAIDFWQKLKRVDSTKAN